jgi:integrase
MLADFPIYQTEATHFLAVLNHKKAGVSTNVWLRILHNRALDLGWLLAPVMPKRAWPKIQHGVRRAITAKEHENILASEQMLDYALFFKLLWETGGSQSDVAHLNAEDIDWSALRLFYTRRKLAKRGGGRAFLAVGPKMEAVLRQLPSTGPLFPRLRLLGEDERASHFRKVCLLFSLAIRQRSRICFVEISPASSTMMTLFLIRCCSPSLTSNCCNVSAWIASNAP